MVNINILLVMLWVIFWFDYLSYWESVGWIFVDDLLSRLVAEKLEQLPLPGGEFGQLLDAAYQTGAESVRLERESVHRYDDHTHAEQRLSVGHVFGEVLATVNLPTLGWVDQPLNNSFGHVPGAFDGPRVQENLDEILITFLQEAERRGRQEATYEDFQLVADAETELADQPPAQKKNAGDAGTGQPELDDRLLVICEQLGHVESPPQQLEQALGNDRVHENLDKLVRDGPQGDLALFLSQIGG